MAKSTPSTIILRGDPIYEERPLEALDACGNGFITPGMLVEYYGDSVRPHSTDGGQASPIFAVEGQNPDSSSITLGDIDEDYDTDAQAVKMAVCRPGTRVYALIAPLTTVTQNAVMDSNGDGYLGTGSTNPVCRALEAVNNSAGTTPARIEVEVL